MDLIQEKTRSHLDCLFQQQIFKKILNSRDKTLQNKDLESKSQSKILAFPCVRIK